MNKIEKLIQELCPQGVEFRALGEVCDFKNGFAFKSGLFKENGLPIVRITNVDGKNINLTDVKYFDPSDYKENTTLYEVSKGDILIAMSGATTGKIGYYSHDTAAYINQRVGKFLPKQDILNNRYLYHYLLSKVEEIYVIAGGGAQPNLSSNALMAKIKIPIPPLAIQKEIVKILDNFTRLEAELEAELEARKKQHEHYREELLSFEEGGVDYLPMGQEGIGKFIRGGGLQKKDFTETGVGCIHYGQIYTHYGTYVNKTKTYVSKEFAKKSRKAKSGDLVIATTSENDEDVCKAVAWIGSEEIAVSSDACIYRHNLNPKYVSYFFQTEQFQKQKRPYITGTKVRRVNADNLAKILIPIPSPEEQARIVAILDKFDALVNDISIGLPAEITARKKQYEYYRNQLLTFKPLELQDAN